MAMLAGGAGRSKAEMNVTPMIDVLLVLIIIFMVILPTKSEGLKALVPQPPSPEQRPSDANAVVITVFEDSTVQLNQEQPLPVAALEERLRGLFKSAAHNVIFVRGGKDLAFQPVADVIDIAHRVGIEKVALMTQ